MHESSSKNRKFFALFSSVNNKIFIFIFLSPILISIRIDGFHLEMSFYFKFFINFKSDETIPGDNIRLNFHCLLLLFNVYSEQKIKSFRWIYILVYMSVHFFSSSWQCFKGRLFIYFVCFPQYLCSGSDDDELDFDLKFSQEPSCWWWWWWWFWVTNDNNQ